MFCWSKVNKAILNFIHDFILLYYINLRWVCFCYSRIAEILFLFPLRKIEEVVDVLILYSLLLLIVVFFVLWYNCMCNFLNVLGCWQIISINCNNFINDLMISIVNFLGGYHFLRIAASSSLLLRASLCEDCPQKTTFLIKYLNHWNKITQDGALLKNQ